MILVKWSSFPWLGHNNSASVLSPACHNPIIGCSHTILVKTFVWCTCSVGKGDGWPVLTFFERNQDQEEHNTQNEFFCTIPLPTKQQNTLWALRRERKQQHQSISTLSSSNMTPSKQPKFTVTYVSKSCVRLYA